MAEEKSELTQLAVGVPGQECHLVCQHANHLHPQIKVLVNRGHFLQRIPEDGCMSRLRYESLILSVHAYASSAVDSLLQLVCRAQ